MDQTPPAPKRTLLAVASGIAAFLFVWFEWRLILLAFAGFLLAILLDTVSGWVQSHTRLGPKLSYVATLFGIAAVMAGAGLLIIPRAINQFNQLAVVVPQSIAQAKLYLEDQRWGASLLHLLHQAMSGSKLETRLPMATRAVTEGSVDLIVVLVVGFFGALNPGEYKRGIFLLVPAKHRERARQIGGKVTQTLRWWLLGQMVPMAALGLSSMVVLWLLGVHLAFTLGLLTGLMVFVPYAGSILSGIAAILIAFEQGPRTALIVFVFYTVFHVVEGYFLTPLVQKRAVLLPPILTVMAQFFMWSFGGLLGVAVAAPLAATGLVLVKELYLESSSGRQGAPQK